MAHILRRGFFERRPQTVASELLGKSLVRRLDDGSTRSIMITETEAYDGPRDLACHASKGRTKRTEVMFGPAGHWYIYFVYGMYDMLNIVTGEEGYPSAVLIRGVEGIRGPGKLARELEITRALNAKSASRASGLWIEDRGVAIKPQDIKRTPRIGVAYAGSYARKPWRFVLHKRRN